VHSQRSRGAVMADVLLSTHGLLKRFGGLVATNSLDLDIVEGEIHALIGPNGAGKTTLVAQLAGELAPDGGSIRFAGSDITRDPPAARALRGLARSFQVTTVFAEFSVLDNVALEPARAYLAEVGLADRAEIPAGTLAHGEKRALELAMVLATLPRLLLLDEPMAGMGPEDSARM
jgi:branched-chain amino acid transport system ATP-binding protein